MDAVDGQVVTLIARIGEVRPETLREMVSVAEAARTLSLEGTQGSYSDKHGRNDKVLVTKNGEEKEIKWKKLEEFQREGWMIKS
jgi:hypothetical protein